MSVTAVVALSVAIATASCSQTAITEGHPAALGSSPLSARPGASTTGASQPQTSSAAPDSTATGDARALGGEAFKKALDRLDSARTAVYRRDLVMKNGDVRLSDEVTTDTATGLTGHRVHEVVTEKGRKAEVNFRVAQDAEGHGWVAATNASGRPIDAWKPIDTQEKADKLLQVFGILVGPGRPTLVAPGVESISILHANGDVRQLAGTMPGQSAIYYLGFANLSDQLDAMIQGSASVEVNLAHDGTINTVVVTGVGSTLATDVADLPAAVSSQISGTVTTIRYLSVNKPVSIPLPPALERSRR
ncbi:hypothetical protein [Terrabacter sp. Soil811]|jgi:hypothetical protein|uniref:hypothetical protein n=1 Tax=Terrabacter sp. Soil811 TaxID=1736419 RepID=UPI0012E3825C|nr:hypothetical protein [Terrabacter sp. Soil811]